MKRLLILIIMIGLLAACSPAAPATEAAQPETAPPTPVVEATATAITPQVEEPTAEPSPQPVEPTATIEFVETDSCVDCHSDKDRLIEVADSEQEVISENKGEG